LALAERLDAEILSVDSMQVYRGMDVGTAKPGLDLCRRVRHHLIDLVDPEESFTVAQFQDAGRAVLDSLEAEGRAAVIAGGSGLHFRSLVDPMRFPPTDADVRAELEAAGHEALVGELLAVDPDAARFVDVANPRRVLRAVEIYRLVGEVPSVRAGSEQAHALRSYRAERPFVAVGLDPGDRLEERVRARFDAMLDSGLVAEVASLADRMSATARQGVGYKQMLAVVRGEESLAAGREAAIRATLALAKRQRTFFRRDPRIRWLPWHDGPDERLSEAASVLEEETTWIL
jgi:tRNA dimethylallyltransferase